MSHKWPVPLWLILFLVSIPQLSETIYVPALINLSAFFDISANDAEFTLTIYLLGFGCGVLLWGALSDKIGRKPCFLMGFLLYGFSCIICYTTKDISIFYIARFFQAFGASVGSVLTQSVARDITDAENRGKLFSLIAQFLAFAPAIGPVIGSSVLAYSEWKNVFLILVILSIIAVLSISIKLPETRDVTKIMHGSFIKRYLECFFQMVKDPKILSYGFLVGSVNGLLFGYFAEAPFFFIENLKISTSFFGFLAFGICIPLWVGGYISRLYHSKQIHHVHVIQKGIFMIMLFSLTFYFFTLSSQNLLILNSHISIFISTFCIWGCIAGVALIIPNALSHALQEYGHYVGTASSLFGFYYYLIVSLMTGLMAYMHNGSITRLPLFILLQGISMYIVYKCVLEKKEML
jgi:DHA1 family bicyclomycin/chloramphenicol resistance-like MFS transporter